MIQINLNLVFIDHQSAGPLHTYEKVSVRTGDWSDESEKRNDRSAV